MVSTMDGSDGQVPTERRGKRWNVRSLVIAVCVIVAGVTLVVASFSIDALSSAGLEVPGPGLYVFALGLILCVLGLMMGDRALSGVPQAPGPGN